jgi:hypothetical protein
VTETQVDGVAEQLRNRRRLGLLDLPADELGQCVPVDPILNSSSFASC